MRPNPETLKLVVINVEGSKHLPEVIPFLRSEAPHAVLMQEVFGPDVHVFKQHLGVDGVHVPMYGRDYDGPTRQWGEQNYGLAVLSRLPISSFTTTSYGNPLKERDSFAKVLATASVSHEAGEFDLSTTHFTWSPDGQTTPAQLADLERLIESLANRRQFTLGGDFNAPRGREIWAALAARYKDNIPSHVTTTIDAKKHRAGDLQLVVDGLWTTSLYQVGDIRIQDGISDHCAIVAEIRKVDSHT